MSKIGSICFNCCTVDYSTTHEEVAYGFINNYRTFCLQGNRLQTGELVIDSDFELRDKLLKKKVVPVTFNHGDELLL